MANFTQQGFDASAEMVGVYDSTFKPKTFVVDEQTFKSSATAKPALVSIQAGVSLHAFFVGCFKVVI